MDTFAIRNGYRSLEALNVGWPLLFLDLLEAAPRLHAVGSLSENLGAGEGLLVLHLEEEPLGPLSPPSWS